MSLRSLIRAVRKQFSTYEPLITVRISRAHILHNLHTYRKTYPNVQIAPVLKSNAYGHGLVEVASILDGESCAFFVLDSLHEALVLRKSGVRSPLLVIGYTPVPNMHTTRLPHTAFTITSLSQLQELAETGVTTHIHIKLDTGMHRQGLREEEWVDACALITKHPSLILEGVCSHFADADNSETSYTRMQCDAWERGASLFKKHFPTIHFFHISATSGIRFGTAGGANVARVGLGLYGIDAAPNAPLPLKQTLRIETVLSDIKNLLPEEAVGYNCAFRAMRPMQIATIPMGYFEGIDRRLSNKGYVTVRGIPCPIVGRVSMNITTIDVSAVPNVRRGDAVVVISATPAHSNSVEDIARTCETIPWEILVHIPQHLRRVVE